MRFQNDLNGFQRVFPGIVSGDKALNSFGKASVGSRVEEVEVAIHLDDGGTAIVIEGIMRAIAEGEFLGLPAAAERNGFTFAHFDAGADMAP